MAPSIWDQDPECQNADDAGLTNYRNVWPVDAVTKLALTATLTMNLWDLMPYRRYVYLTLIQRGPWIKRFAFRLLWAPTALLHAAMRKIASASAQKTSSYHFNCAHESRNIQTKSQKYFWRIFRIIVQDLPLRLMPVNFISNCSRDAETFDVPVNSRFSQNLIVLIWLS